MTDNPFENTSWGEDLTNKEKTTRGIEEDHRVPFSSDFDKSIFDDMETNLMEEKPFYQDNIEELEEKPIVGQIEDDLETGGNQDFYTYLTEDEEEEQEEEKKTTQERIDPFKQKSDDYYEDEKDFEYTEQAGAGGFFSGIFLAFSILGASYILMVIYQVVFQ